MKKDHQAHQALFATHEAKKATAQAWAQALAPRKPSPPSVLSVACRHPTLFQRLARAVGK